MKLENSGGQVNKRRKNALLRLQKQLNTGVWYCNPITGDTTLLDENQTKRINKEIANLKAKIVSDETARNDKPKKYRAVR